MDLSTIKDLYVGSTPAQSVWLGGIKVWERKTAVDIQSIFDAMVLWYDLKRQDATNESMSQNPILKDLSGHGHDATCYNFAWSGMSGIGGYPANSSNVNIQSNRAEWINSYTAKVTNAANGNLVLQGTPITGEQGHPFLLSIKEVHFRISGLTEGQAVVINHGLNNGNSTTWITDIRVSTNGEYTIPALNEVIEPYDTNSTPRCINNRFTVYGTDVINNIIIEFLPEYPNALVADGVDDYAQALNIPALTDYTVIAKRKILDLSAPNYVGLVEKGGKGMPLAFILEYTADSNSFHTTVSYRTISNIVLDNDNLITWQTPTSYNGQQIKRGEDADIDCPINIFRFEGSVGQTFMSGAIYSFILFNRTLTNDEIEWVKDNLIEGTLRIPEALLIDAWIFSGHTNEEAPTQITGEKGTALNCYNFAWNEEGSGFKDGYLCFDGVGDYLENKLLFKEPLTDFTVICRREILKYKQWSIFARDTGQYGTSTSAFYFGYLDMPSYPTPHEGVLSFGNVNILDIDIAERVSYMTPTSYNGTAISRGAKNSECNGW